MSSDTDDSTPPKVFVSYRWSSPDHEEWVLAFATALPHAAVDVILDKWHLSEGQDTLAFMESMVSDPQVKKVLMICDRSYVERANGRQGGVGTEAQIISAKVYQSTDQDKFAAIVVELDADGRPFLPHYMATRLYFDMSSPEAEATNLEKVVRWIYGKPFHALPPLGERPAFLSETHPTSGRLVALCMQERSFQAAADILSMPLFKSASYDLTGEAVSYNVFRASPLSLHRRNERLKLRRLSLHADLLSAHHETSLVPFVAFLEADITLYVRGLIAPKYRWFPESAVFLERSHGSLPTYARATSSKFYNRLKPLLMDVSASDLRSKVQASRQEGNVLHFDGYTIPLERALNLEQLGTSA